MDCSECDRHFRSLSGFRAHCRDCHYYCEQCDRFFASDNGLQQHLDYSLVHKNNSFDDNDSDSDENNSDRYCTACDRWFNCQESLFQHLARNPRHNYCFICSRDFSTQDALDKHSASRVHNDRNIDCVFCSKSFKTPSALALHIENGGCGKGITRQQVTWAAKCLAPPAFSSRLLTGPTQNTVHYSASEHAWNGMAYECYLCHRTFRDLVSLNKHLNSPAHDAAEFKCPKCKRPYKLISGLIQHIESEVCGFAKFQQVMDHTSGLTDRFKNLLTF